MNSHNDGNNRTIHTRFGRSRDCVIYTFLLTLSTFIFVASMILTVYLTHIARMDKVVVVLIVGSCFLYIFGFTSSMYSLYYSKPNCVVPLENGRNSNRLSQIARDSLISSNVLDTSSNVRPPDILGFSRAREHFRQTPPPPYEVQMSEMSRMLLPGTSRTTESSARDEEIAKEARKLVQRLYEEIQRTDSLVPQSSVDEQSKQQVIQKPKTPIRMQRKMSLPNLVVQKQQTAVENCPGRRLSSGRAGANPFIQKEVKQSPIPTGINPIIQKDVTPSPIPTRSNPIVQKDATPRPMPIRKNSVIQKDVTPSPIPTRINPVIQKDVTPSPIPTRPHLGRLINDRVSCIAANSNLSPRVSGPSSADQVIRQEIASNQLSSSPGLERFVIGGEACPVSWAPLSPKREGVTKVALKRKLTSSYREQQTKPKTKVNITPMTAIGGNSQDNEYEEIQVTGGIVGANLSHVVYDSVECCSTGSDFEDTSERETSVASAASEPGPSEPNESSLTQNMKARRLLSILSTSKLIQLDKSPDSLLDAIATCFDLTPDEWTAAWKLRQRGMSPNDTSRILGVRLQDTACKNDN